MSNDAFLNASESSQEPHSYIREYWQDIIDGRAIVGSYVKKQVEILLYELDNPNYKIDFSESEKRIKFIERECRHSEAPFAGKPFLLMTFQKAIIEALFAIKVYNEELGRYIRKYQELLLVIARKNGKTPLASAISLAEWVCGEMGTKILYGSNDYDQADLLYMATDAMREASPKLAKCTRRNQKGIFFGNVKQKSHVGKFTSQNKGSIRKLSAKTSAKEGRNIKVGVVDEVHELADESFVMPIKQALSTQDEPIYLELTTEGFVDGYLDERLKLAASILNGEISKPNMLIFWYSQDSEEEIWQDEQSWYKSNPALGVVKKWSFLRGMVEDAKLSAATRAFVLSKDFNIKQNSAASWLTSDTILNDDTFDMEKIRGQFYIGGFDLSETVDLTAAAAIFIDPATMQKYALSHYFVPEAKADAVLGDDNDKLNPERKNYRQWAAEGLVTICPGNEVDTSMVSQWYFDLLLNYDARPYKIGYDAWHAGDLRNELARLFGNEVLERIPMNFGCMSNAMGLLESDLSFKKLNYRNNNITKWCLGNVAIKLNNLGQMMPVKAYGSSKNRIDGAVALIISYATFSRYRKDYLDLQRAAIRT